MSLIFHQQSWTVRHHPPEINCCLNIYIKDNWKKLDFFTVQYQRNLPIIHCIIYTSKISAFDCSKAKTTPYIFVVKFFFTAQGFTTSPLINWICLLSMNGMFKAITNLVFAFEFWKSLGAFAIIIHAWRPIVCFCILWNYPFTWTYKLLFHIM